MGPLFGPASVFERPTVAHVQVVRPTLVLGSAQDPDIVDRATLERAGVDLARRRSGGGAVLLTPADTLWLEVFVPADHALGSDAPRLMRRLGHVLADIVAATSPAHDVGVAESGRTDPLGRCICFAGLGVGEVLVDGRKAVGLSARRGRWGTRLQIGAHTGGDIGAVVGYLRPDAFGRSRSDAVAALGRRACSLPVDAGLAVPTWTAALAAHLDEPSPF